MSISAQTIISVMAGSLVTGGAVGIAAPTITTYLTHNDKDSKVSQTIPASDLTSYTTAQKFEAELTSPDSIQNDSDNNKINENRKATAVPEPPGSLFAIGLAVGAVALLKTLKKKKILQTDTKKI